MELSVMLQLLISGLGMTLQIFIITLVGALPLGVLVALARMSSFKPLALVARFFISVLRGTPLMLQLMAWMFFPYYVFGMSLTSDWKFYACAIGFILNYSAYFAEIYRSGIQSIPRGQYEAAQVLGFTKWQTFLRIILPQTVKRILLPVSNEVITLVKDTSLATAIAVSEMYLTAKNATSASGSVEPLFLAGVFYLLMNAAVTFVFGRLIKRFDYYHD